jgi:uncharacterized protein YqjF (DUF2071 family)
MKEGRRGVVFCSLEASRLATVALTRWTTGLNYLWARMRLRAAIATGWTYTHPAVAGRGRVVPRRRCVVRVGEEIDPSPLEQFLTARWGLFLPDRRGRTRYWPNEHATWPLRAATLEAPRRPTGRGGRLSGPGRATTDQRAALVGGERALRPAPTSQFTHTSRIRDRQRAQLQ